MKTTTLLNKNGWRAVNPPIAGTAATCIPGLLIARDDRTGLGAFRKQNGEEIKIHTQWFVPHERKEASTPGVEKVEKNLPNKTP